MERIARWSAMTSAGLAGAGAVVAVVAPLGGTNRVLGVAAPFAIAAVAMALSIMHQGPIFRGLLSTVAALALAYGIVLALSLPLRLTIVATCPTGAALCPAGFEPQARAAESFAVFACTVLGAIAFMLVFLAIEARRARRPRATGEPKQG